MKADGEFFLPILIYFDLNKTVLKEVLGTDYTDFTELKVDVT